MWIVSKIISDIIGMIKYNKIKNDERIKREEDEWIEYYLSRDNFDFVPMFYNAHYTNKLIKRANNIKEERKLEQEKKERELEKKEKQTKELKRLNEIFYKEIQQVKKDKELTLIEMNKRDNCWALNERNKFVVRQNINNQIYNCEVSDD